MIVNLIQSAIYFFKDVYSNIGFAEVLDILIVSVLVYAGLVLLKRTRSFFVFGGLLVLLLIYLLARFLNLQLTSLLFQFFFTFFALIVVVVFQRELKNFFAWISSFIRHRLEFFFGSKKIIKSEEGTLDAIIKATAYFSHNKIGALIVLEGRQPLEGVIESGYFLNGRVSLPILLSIFDPSSAGHDGAVIIKEDVIKQFGAHLPLAQRFMKFGYLGTRHRAALGLAERSDALIIIVSEERGTISLAHLGNLRATSAISEFKEGLEKFLKEKQPSPLGKNVWYGWFKHNIREKILALVFALILWVIFVPSSGIVTQAFKIPIEFRLLKNDYVLDQLNPTEIDVSFSGKRNNFQMFDPRNLFVRIDLSKFGAGWHTVPVLEQNIEGAGSLSVIDFSPRSIKVHIIEKTPAQTAGQSPGS